MQVTQRKATQTQSSTSSRQVLTDCATVLGIALVTQIPMLLFRESKWDIVDARRCNPDL